MKKKKEVKFDKVQKSRSGRPTVAVVVLLSHWWSSCRKGGRSHRWSYCRIGGLIVASVVALPHWCFYCGLIVALVVLLSHSWSYCRRPICRLVVVLSQNGGFIVADWWSCVCVWGGVRC